MGTQWGKKINIYKTEKITSRCMSSVKMYKNMNKVYIKPVD
jgi:hypothetical protein